jgi:hypothetical protein
LAGRVPDELAAQFAADTFELKTHELGEKYEIALSTAKDWRLDCKRRLGLPIGYGTGSPTVSGPVVEGLVADDDLIDPDELWKQAIGAQHARQTVIAKRDDQTVTVPNEPVGVAFLSDTHFGDPSTDYEYLRRDAEIIRDTDGLYAGYHGDGINNWIIPKLARLQRGEALPFDGEMQLFRNWLGMLNGKLLWSVAGNHDNWTRALAGIDFVREALRGTMSLYDPEEVVFRLVVGPSDWTFRARHQWPWKSIFNDTHGLEVGWQRGEIDYDIAIGGHTHTGTLHRPFIRHQKRRHAILTGTYKIADEHGRHLGYSRPQDRGCGAMIFHPDGRTFFTEDLETAADFLQFLRG